MKLLEHLEIVQIEKENPCISILGGSYTLFLEPEHQYYLQVGGKAYDLEGNCYNLHSLTVSRHNNSITYNAHTVDSRVIFKQKLYNKDPRPYLTLMAKVLYES